MDKSRKLHESLSKSTITDIGAPFTSNQLKQMKVAISDFFSYCNEGSKYTIFLITIVGNQTELDLMHLKTYLY